MVHLVKVLSGFYAITLSQARSVGAETSAPQYHLKTHVVDSVCPDKDNLYVLSYHTGKLLLSPSPSRVLGVNSFLVIVSRFPVSRRLLKHSIRSWIE